MTKLTVSEPLADTLGRFAAHPVESAGVLLVGVAASHGREPRLLAREFVEIPETEYLAREADRLELTSGGWVPALTRAAEAGSAALFVHTHPNGAPVPSEHDRRVDEQIYDTFAVRTGQSCYGSLVLTSSSAAPGFLFTGQVWLEGRTPSDTPEGTSRITECLTIGRRFRLSVAFDARGDAALSSQFDRQIRAFGGDVQSLLGSLHVGVAGAGGTGSAVLEQLVRLGVRQLTVVDPDTLSTSNVTRVFGSRLEQVGSAKAQLQADHLKGIAPDLDVRVHVARTTDLDAAHALSGCDVVFGCTDDDAGRIVLSRLASYYLIPVIDCGVLLASDNGNMQGIYGRVTTLTPGAACLLCRNRIDVARAGAELMEEEELRDLQAEGYAPELGGIEPAVVPYTTLVAALAVGELLERLIGYGADPAPTELIARIHDRELSTNSRLPNQGHFCDPASGLIGLGDTTPMLHWSWSA
ncbi:MAG: ThiF family adenylyltransferase [Actinomycetes bacterium]